MLKNTESELKFSYRIKFMILVALCNKFFYAFGAKMFVKENTFINGLFMHAWMHWFKCIHFDGINL